MSTLLNLTPIFPEIFVLLMVLIILIVDSFFVRYSKIPYYFALITLVTVFWLTYYAFSESASSVSLILHRMFILDSLSFYLKLFIYLSVFYVFLCVREYNQIRKVPDTEFYVSGLLSLLGMMVLVSSHNLLITFLGIELLFLPTCTMIAMRYQNSRCVEAGIKYFVTGIAASGILAYGMSMIFGVTRSLDFTTICTIVDQTSVHKNAILVFSLVFIVTGIAFKLGAAPFHMWIPDVYEGAPSSTALFISTAPKIAIFSMIIRLLVDTLTPLQWQWHKMLIVISILSMGIGNFTAILQSNVKKMLAYSSIAHMGYMLLGVLCGTKEGYAAAMFYVITYSFTTLGSFSMIILMSVGHLEAENIKDFSGLNKRNPWLAFVMLLILSSLAGVPPLVGFIAKVGILDALIRAHLIWLAALSVFFTVIGAYYYIRLIKVMYFDSSSISVQPVQYSLKMNVMISVSGLTIFFTGMFPEWLYTLVHLTF
ncbi:NADH-quinone oxidoreductase subunit NuoN [Coxiella-like endosymbiont of Amblyomma americanum]|uniref:NADH-quinone oxidoreductase subunit NuoN n=1 Tax=Coxiella-like endosymbiont of Amblyomma americanum TaxID=1987500 RepID=UPI0011D13539|nr:NADH-quinone oxidoreductase subunit NuoN [Coxiella-like endosymbiont of Amblyomma americanum]